MSSSNSRSLASDRGRITMLFHDFIIDHTASQPLHFVRPRGLDPPSTHPMHFLFVLFKMLLFSFKKNIRL
jgi:hypothetical protein